MTRLLRIHAQADVLVGLPFDVVAQLLVEGKISPQTFEEWNRETGGRRLPEHVKPKSKARSRKTKTKAKRKARAGK